ncbi:MAG: hypothetical protein QM484_07115 [Woeseiaceae bacterium]
MSDDNKNKDSYEFNKALNDINESGFASDTNNYSYLTKEIHRHILGNSSERRSRLRDIYRCDDGELYGVIIANLKDISNKYNDCYGCNCSKERLVEIFDEEKEYFENSCNDDLW